MRIQEKKRILLVEDEMLTAMMETRILERAGYQVVQAASGPEAIEAARNQVFDLVLMDLDLGEGMDGTEAARTILLAHNIPVVFLSSHTERAVVERTEDITSYGYIVKNTGETVLLASISMAFKLFAAKCELQESESRYRGLHQHMIEGSALHELVYDEQGRPIDYRIVDANTAFENQLGLSRATVIGKTGREAYGVPESPYLDIYSRVAETGVTASFETYFPAMDRHFNISVYCPKPGFFATVFENISERKRAEEKLAELYERLNLATRSAGLGIWDWDILKDHLTWDERMFQLYGISPGAFSGAYAAWLAGVHPEDRAKCDEAIQLALKGIRDYDLEFRVRWPGGEEHVIRAFGMIIRDGEGKPVRMVGVNSDVTDQSLAGSRIRKLLAEKELLLREVHHRVKNNLGVVQGMLSLQAEVLEQEAARACLIQAVSRVQSIGLLYDRLYRSELTGTLALGTYLPSLIDEIVAIFPAAREVRIETDIDDCIVEVKLLSAIGIIINELLTNAFKYAFADVTDARQRVAAKLSDGTLVILVQDNGIGLPEDWESRGTQGFGLQFVRLLVERENGSFQVNVDKGTSFVMAFPGKWPA